MSRAIQWWSENVFFFAWSRWEKGIYWHVFPRVCVRTLLWQVDWHRKPTRREMGHP